jgi:hypothetical protein
LALAPLAAIVANLKIDAGSSSSCSSSIDGNFCCGCFLSSSWLDLLLLLLLLSLPLNSTVCSL